MEFKFQWVGQLELTLKGRASQDPPAARGGGAGALSVGARFQASGAQSTWLVQDRGLILNEPMDTVIGRVDTDLERHHVLERLVDNSNGFAMTCRLKRIDRWQPCG